MRQQAGKMSLVTISALGLELVKVRTARARLALQESDVFESTKIPADSSLVFPERRGGLIDRDGCSSFGNIAQLTMNPGELEHGWTDRLSLCQQQVVQFHHDHFRRDLRQNQGKICVLVTFLHPEAGRTEGSATGSGAIEFVLVRCGMHPSIKTGAGQGSQYIDGNRHMWDTDAVSWSQILRKEMGRKGDVGP